MCEIDHGPANLMWLYFCTLFWGNDSRTEGSMKLFKIAALVALASLPFLLLKKRSSPAPQVVESEDIFDDELGMS